MQRRTPISRVRSSTFIVIALTSPTMLIATIRKPRMPIAELIWRFASTFRAWSTYRMFVPIGVAGRGEAILQSLSSSGRSGRGRWS